MVSKHVGVRLPEGPGALKEKTYKAETVKAEDGYEIQKPSNTISSLQAESNNTQNNSLTPAATVTPNISQNKN